MFREFQVMTTTNFYSGLERSLAAGKNEGERTPRVFLVSTRRDFCRTCGLG